MLYVVYGTDRDALRREISTRTKKQLVTRVTDAHSIDDLREAIRGGGLFSDTRIVVLENILVNDEMRSVFLDVLAHSAETEDEYLLVEEKIDAATKKTIEKYASSVERFDLPKKERDSSIFAIANALKKGDKKALWVSYMREIEKGAAPEAILGILFWAAKDLFLKSGKNVEQRKRAEQLIARFAELPHESRRKGEDLEYALERFVLTLT